MDTSSRTTPRRVAFTFGVGLRHAVPQGTRSGSSAIRNSTTAVASDGPLLLSIGLGLGRGARLLSARSGGTASPHLSEGAAKAKQWVSRCVARGQDASGGDADGAESDVQY